MLTFLGGLFVGVLGNEVFELMPWLARKVLRLAARVDARVPDERGPLFDEWAAQLDEVPGKLTKLLFALRLLCGVGIARHVDKAWCAVRTPMGITTIGGGVVPLVLISFSDAPWMPPVLFGYFIVWPFLVALTAATEIAGEEEELYRQGRGAEVEARRAESRAMSYEPVF